MTKTRNLRAIITTVAVLTAMICVLFALGTINAGAASASTPTYTGNQIFANGTPITIEAGSSGTSVWYMNGSTKTYLVQNADLSAVAVYGGYDENDFDGDSNITMTGGKVKAIYGAGFYYEYPGNGYVNNVNITVSGGTVVEGVYATHRNRVNGNVNITMTGGTVRDIYGCPRTDQQTAGHYNCHVAGDVSIVVTGGTVSGKVHGGDGYNVISGSVSGVFLVPVKLYHYNGFTTDMAYYFDNVIYLNGSDWVIKGNTTIAEGQTLTIAKGQAMTIKNSNFDNRGTIVNNGTINVEGTWKNNGTIDNKGTFNVNAYNALSTVHKFNNSGTVNFYQYNSDYGISGNGDLIRHAAYIENVSSVSSVSAWIDGASHSLTSYVGYELVDGTLYLWLPDGDAKVTLNGTDYAGKAIENSRVKLTEYALVTGFEGIPETVFLNMDYKLDAIPISSTGTDFQFTQTISYEVMYGTTATNVTLENGTLRTAGTGLIKLKVTAKDTYTTKEFVYEIQASELTSNTLDITNGAIVISEYDETRLKVEYFAFEGGYKLIDKSEPITVTGRYSTDTGNLANNILVQSGEVNLILDNCTIQGYGPLVIKSGASVTMSLVGENSMKGSTRYNGGVWSYYDGISIAKGANLTIGGSGSLDIESYDSAGIYVPAGAELTINSGTISAKGGDVEPGIGSKYRSDAGTITINGGTVTAIGAEDGAGIGGACYGSGGIITINGGTVIATGGWGATGIGSGSGVYNGQGGYGGTITINGGTVIATGGDEGAGIGAGRSGLGATITITGGDVTATGGSSGAGIGGGKYSEGVFDVTITGGEVTATGGENGTDIQGELSVERGIVNNCYYISEKEDLLAFAEYVNTVDNTLNAKLLANIVLNENVLNENGELNGDGTDFTEWTIINNLSGTFDGNGYYISGLYINGDEGYVGFVKDLNGEIKNLGIVDSYIRGGARVAAFASQAFGKVTNSYNAGTVIGTKEVGGIIGFCNDGEITNCYNKGSIIGGDYVGGIVGYGHSPITNCYNEGTVIGTAGIVISDEATSKGQAIGGIVGYYNNNAVTNCFNTGTVSGVDRVGGIAGWYNVEDNAAIVNCFNMGAVKGTTGVGTIVGHNNGCPVTNSYYLENCGGNTDYGTAKTAEQFKSGEVAYLLGAGFGQILGMDDHPVIVNEINKVYMALNCQGDTIYSNTDYEDGYHIGGSATCTVQAVCTLCGTSYGDLAPHEGGKATCLVLAVCEACGASYGELADHVGGTPTCTTLAACEICGEGHGELDPDNHEFDKNNGFCCDVIQPAELNGDGYYEIGNAGQLFWFANHVNTVDRTASAILTADIDLENRPWTPIGSTGADSNNFRGVFDGQYHTIRGLYVEGGRAGLGFFGEVRTGTVKNFTIYGEVIVNGEYDYIGGVFGSACGLNSTDHYLERNGATIQNIISYVNVTAKAHGIGMIGGFVGYANHETLIENCSWYGTFDAGIYRVDSGAGGFIGRIYDNSAVTIRNCAAYGTIKTNYEKNSFNNTATIFIGGFLSYSSSGAQTVLENCLFAGRFEIGENMTDEAELAAFGTISSIKSISNCYYLGDGVIGAVHSGSTYGLSSDNVDISVVTEEQLLSGGIAYRLGSAWGQDLKGGEEDAGYDAYPVVGGAKVYFGYVSCAEDATMIYSNDANASETKPEHNMIAATCASPATCKNGCGYTEGEVDPDGHVSEASWIWFSGTQHIFECDLCDYVEYGNHTGGDGSCMPVCEVCDEVYRNVNGKHNNMSNWFVYQFDTTLHARQCLDCGGAFESEEHTGTSATCTEKAYCEVCKSEYGEVDPNAHDIVIDKGYEPTCTEKGLTDGQHCSRCDGATKAQEEIDELGHDWIDATYDAPKTCDVCGETEGDPLKKDEESTEPEGEDSTEPEGEDSTEPEDEESETDVSTETEKATDTETEKETDTETEKETDTETEKATDTETETEKATDTETETETEPETETDATVDTPTETEPEVGPDVDGENATDAATDAATDDVPDKGGCGSSISIGAISIVATLAIAALGFRKKED